MILLGLCFFATTFLPSQTNFAYQRTLPTKIDAKTEKDDKALQKNLRTPKTILQHQHFFFLPSFPKGKHFSLIFHRLT